MIESDLKTVVSFGVGSFMLDIRHAVVTVVPRTAHTRRLGCSEPTKLPTSFIFPPYLSHINPLAARKRLAFAAMNSVIATPPPLPHQLHNARLSPSRSSQYYARSSPNHDRY